LINTNANTTCSGYQWTPSKQPSEKEVVIFIIIIIKCTKGNATHEQG
jgi:hypothetical protein